MFADLMNSLPSIKSSILYLFEAYLGIKLDLTNFSLDKDNNLFIQLTNIKFEPNIINNNYLKNINIKITKGDIEKLELKVGINTLEINLSKLSLTLMPVISINKEKEKEKEEEKNIKEEEKNEKINNDDNKNNEKEQKGIISSFIDYYLSKLKISIDEIELIAFNYEITNKNLTLANPVICFNLYKIKYDKGKIKESIDKSYIRKTIWENKHFSIDALCLKICKSFNLEEKDINKSDITNKKNLYDVENNDNIMVINTEKGIHFYTNTKNEILGEVGDIQLIINLFQLELFKNFIDAYITYFNLGKDKNIEIKKDKKENEINIKNTNLTKSVINNKSNNEIMNLKITLSSLSLIILERNQNPTEVKLNEYSKDKMNEHFCYFEDNFLIFILYNICLQYNTKKELTSLNIEEIGLNYVEYISKEKKEEEIEIVKRTGSEYSECSDIGIFRNNEVFKSIAEEGINVKNYYCSYDYRYNKNQVLLIKNIKLDFFNGKKDKNKINFELNSFICNFHPIYLFKILKLLYENSFLIKEVLFYNYDQINEEKKLKKGENKEEENILIENNNINNEEPEKKEENGDNLNLSFLSNEEKEDELNIENKKESNINIKEKDKSDNIIYKSDLIFDSNNSNNKEKQEEKINEKIKKILESLTFEIKIKVIELKIFSFKCDNEFYYEHIYIMDIKDDFKQQRLKINEISSKDYFTIMIKNISIKNITNDNNEILVLKFYPLIISFSNNKLLEFSSDTFPIKYDLEKNEINVYIKINFFFKVKLFPYILSFINIWKYTLLLFDIFQQRMIFNFNKGKNELEQMNHEKNILKYIEEYRNIKKDLDENNNNIINLNNNDNTNLLNIEIKIPFIKIEFDILPQKIKSGVNIKDIALKYSLNKMTNKITFTTNEINSKEFDLLINSILINVNLSKEKNENYNYSNLQKFKNKKNKKNLNFNIVSPGESIEIYIENILRFKQKQRALESLEPKFFETKTDINIALKSIKVSPVESILFLNDIYNVIGREEIYNNSNNEKNKMLLSKSMQRISTSSSGSKKTKNTLELIASKRKSDNSFNENIEDNKNNGKDLLNINFNIDNLKCIINDDSTFRTTELNIYNINLKNKIFNIKKIDFSILYEIEDFGEKVLVNLCEINDINLSIFDKENNNFSYQMIISSIIISLCKDSFAYIENVLDHIANILSNCFVQAKKGNKIVISQNKDVLLGTRDTKLEDDQEIEVFGGNEAKSICLDSTNDDFVLEIDENYLDNLLNEKEEVLDNIDDLFKSNLREKKKENEENNELNLSIIKIQLGLYSGLDFESVDEIKCKSDEEYNNKEKEKEKEEFIELKKDDIDLNENINITEEIDKNKEKTELKNKNSDFEMIEYNPYKKISGREKNNYLLFDTKELNLNIIYIQNNSYEIDFYINNFEVSDNLKKSNFKRLLFPSKNINIGNNINEEKTEKFLSIFVDISNSQNKLSMNNYSDFNIVCEISLSSIQLLIHQNALLFLLNFFIQDNTKLLLKT